MRSIRVLLLPILIVFQVPVYVLVAGFQQRLPVLQKHQSRIKLFEHSRSSFLRAMPAMWYFSMVISA